MKLNIDQTLPNPYTNTPAASLYLALLVSLLIHSSVFFGLKTPQRRVLSKQTNVSLVKLSKPNELPSKPERIVSPSDVNQISPNREAKLLSDQNSRTTQQTLRRAKQPPASESSRPTAAKRPKSISKDKTNKLRSIRLSQKTILSHIPDIASRKNSSPTTTSKNKTQQTEIEDDKLLSKYSPFSHQNPIVSDSARLGHSDYLPEIPDGDITFLNAKAHRHAVFVRRVAMQVFGALRRESWQELPPTEIRKIRSFATVRAILSPNGKLLSVSLFDSSGSAPFNKVLLSAANAGAWDQNPPSGVLGFDGNIHFVFKARTWSRGSQDGLRETRWILLATGLL